MDTKNIKYVRESEWNTDKEVKTFFNLNSRYVVLMDKIKKFYSNKNNLNILMSIINGESFISLRVIDFFVTNYAREKEIIYKNTFNLDNKKNTSNENEQFEYTEKDTETDTFSKQKTSENFMVYYSYKSQLKAYSKKQFDPFCRRERILFFIGDYNGIKNEPVRTTVGQLNFFRWAIKNNILDYIYKNYETIENNMNMFSKKSKKKVLTSIKKNVKKKSKTPFVLLKNNKTDNDLTLSATKKVNKHNITITVKFN